jgi:predicted RNA binding protein YcfA (HicA-like mRNA interferase family)
MHWRKTLGQVLDGQADANLRYDDLCHLLYRLGYVSKQKGSHVPFRQEGRDRITLQNAHGKVKSYQVKHVREQLEKHL